MERDMVILNNYVDGHQ